MMNFTNALTQTKTITTLVLMVGLLMGGLNQASFAESLDTTIPMPTDEIVSAVNDIPIGINFSINETTQQLVFNTVDETPLPTEHF